MNYFTLLMAMVCFALTAKSQSNTPCSFPITTPLLVGATCNYTNGTTNGATYSSNNANGGTPSCANPGSPDVWYTFIAPPGGEVNIQTAAGTITDGGMSLYSGSCPNNFTEIECNDDSGPGLMPQILASNLTPGQTYYIRFWKFGNGNGGGGNGGGNGNNNTGTFSICLSIPPPLVDNATCSNPDPICSGTPINFTANTGATPASESNPGNDYGCLATSPNPSWYYLEIDNGGNLVIDVSAGSDVDFAIWGPYPNLTQAVSDCNNYGPPQDCSYSTSEVEQVNLNNVANQEVYILLVTNYANSVQNISVNNNGGTATTNCGIVLLPVELTNWKAELNEKTVELSWLTQSERDNDYFAIQRSVDLNFWETIAFENGAGTTNEIQSYNYSDDAALSGTSYYRLKQVDFNGKSTFSKSIAIENSVLEDQLQLFPNPAKNSVQIKNINAMDIASIVLTNMQGAEMKVQALSTSVGLEIDLKEVESGVYFVQTNLIDGSNYTNRLMVQ